MFTMNIGINLGDPLEVSDPVGNFNPHTPMSNGNVCMLAAGTGITPMIRLISTRLAVDNQ